MPLAMVIDKLGNQATSDVNNIDFKVHLDDVLVNPPEHKERFAIGEYKNLNETEKLSRPGFELYKGGIEVNPTGNQFRSSQAVQRNIRYETTIIDTNYKRNQIRWYETSQWIVNNRMHRHQLSGNEVTKSSLSLKQRSSINPQELNITIKENSYAVVKADDLTLVHAEAIYSSFTLAQDSRKNLDLNEQDYLIIPSSEIFAA